jgi:F-type H+-transporting ATPase subunit gamma
MAKGMRDIKRQIKSIQNTKQITKAMEMVAASRLRRAQQAADASKPYADKIKEVISNIALGTKGIQHPMLQSREVKKTAYFVITSDRGLAGGYNANLLRDLMETIRRKHQSEEEYSVFVAGRKGRDYFKKRNIPVVQEVTGLTDAPQFSEIKELAREAVNYFEEGKCDALYLVFNEFVNPLTQIPTQKQLLPLTEANMEKGASSAHYEYEPSAEGVLEVLLPRYAETLIYSALLEAKAGEFGARMNAMGSATKNATEMISKLTLVYNRARQAAITQEISEIVAGANAQG